MQAGIKNEFDFKNYLNGKKVYELNTNMQNMLYAIFKNINSNSYITCWWSKYTEKADIKIKIEGVVKGLSIKNGAGCSIHQEQLETFNKFLIKIGVDNNILEKFINFIEGNVNGKRVDAITYIQKNEKDIKLIKEELQEYYIQTNLILRFIFQGTEIYQYDCDALIYGSPNQFYWATKSEVLKFLIDYKEKNTKYINTSALFIKCYDRNLKNNPSKINRQKSIQVKWYTIKEDLEQITKIRNNFLNNQIQSFYLNEKYKIKEEI